MSDSERACPVCGDTMYQQGAPGMYWCPECEMEYWREGNGWWRCDESGEPENVKAVADGGTSVTTHDNGIAATGYICQNEPEHPDDQLEVPMVSAGPGENGRICPECGRMTGGPDDVIPYGDPPNYEPSHGLFGPRDRDTFRVAVETWGLPAQIDMAVEECGEVIVALQHLQRERADREEVIEELADLRIMYEQLRWYFGQDFVDPVVRDKMNRLRERLRPYQDAEEDHEGLRTDGGSPELTGDDAIRALDGNYYVELDGVAAEKLVDDVEVELTIVDGDAALSIRRDAGSKGYVGVLGRLPPVTARRLADALNEIADAMEGSE